MPDHRDAAAVRNRDGKLAEQVREELKRQAGEPNYSDGGPEHTDGTWRWPAWHHADTGAPRPS